MKKVAIIAFKVLLYTSIAQMGTDVVTIPEQQQVPTATQDLSFQVHNPTRSYSKLNCLLLLIGENKSTTQISHIIKGDLEFSDQLNVDMKRHNNELDAQTLTKLFQQGTSLCLYLKELASPKKGIVTVQSILKEPSSNQTLFEKTATYSENSLVFAAHSIADALMPVLTGEKGPMLSTIAYCKQLTSRHKVVCIADYTCNYERTVVPAKTINVAPSWHSQAPVLFYSQFTRSNSRLMSYDLRSKQHKIICSYDGLNMQPSFAPDGTKAVLCISSKGNAEIFMYDQALCNKLRKRVFSRVTNNKGNNTSPCYLPNGDIIFCSDFETSLPQLYKWDNQTHAIQRLTNGRGYCAASSFCIKNNSVVYTRYIKGVFQLFTLSLDQKKHIERQLTFSSGDKVEPSWSECGRYVVFAYNFLDKKTQKRNNQIAILNIPSGKIRIITKSKEHKSFPVWTGRTLYA